MNIEDSEENPKNEGGQKERPYRQNRPPRQPREERPPRQEADPNSNFKIYYEKDQSFYLTILKEEDITDAGHEFKL